MSSLPFPCSSLPLSRVGIKSAMSALGVDEPTIWAILEVETQGCGCLSDRRPMILFERHIFSHLTHGQFDATHPGISNPVQGGYGIGGVSQYARLAEAVACDQDAALQSASWGLGQVMGMHFNDLGFASIDDMITAMCASEDQQLAASVAFILNNKLAKFLQAQDWTNYALHYNGRDFAKNRYDTRLSAAHTRFSDGPIPDLDVRIAQACLQFLGFSPKGIDGVVGSNTLLALHNFQTSAGLPLTADINATVAGQLLAALPAPANLPLT
ncbi:MAG: hypothetical protein NVSMB62_29780 [Acidobacteriaceae bacterium]